MSLISRYNLKSRFLIGLLLPPGEINDD